MAETTENYGLVKPEETDYYSIEIQNENMDVIDAALKAQADGIATKASADGLAAHTSNTAVHVTTQEKVVWDGKADSTALTAHTSNTTTHITAAERTAWNSKADAAGMTSHTSNTTVHITAGERSSWNGKANKSVVHTATLAVASWTGTAAPYSITVAVTGVTTTSNQEVLPGASITAAQLKALQEANIQEGSQSANTITLKGFGKKPTVAIPIRIIVRGDV